jgi:hypothetical protein
VPAEVWVRFQEVHILRSFYEDSGTSVQRITAAESIGFPLVWRILHDSHFIHTIHSFILSTFHKSIQKTLDVEIVTDKTVQCT